MIKRYVIIYTHFCIKFNKLILLKIIGHIKSFEIVCDQNEFTSNCNKCIRQCNKPKDITIILLFVACQVYEAIFQIVIENTRQHCHKDK